MQDPYCIRCQPQVTGACIDLLTQAGRTLEIEANAATDNPLVLARDRRDLAANTLPNYVWITPNMCNDTHDCSTGDGDAWLKTWVPQIIASPAWRDRGALFGRVSPCGRAGRHKAPYDGRRGDSPAARR